jgi:hypothetical protein
MAGARSSPETWVQAAPGVATMPWYFSKSFALDDPAAGQLIMGRDVPLYAGPSGAQELARIDWAMSELNGPWEPRRQR